MAYAGDLQDMECSVMAARPSVKITWTFNGRDITADAEAVERHSNHEDTYMTASTLHHVFNQEDDGQTLECVVTHTTFADPDITTSPVTVFSPVAPTPTKVSPNNIKAYSGDLQEIECTVLAAAPAAKITWTFNDKNLTSNAEAKETHNILDGTYMTISTLHQVFTQEDAGQTLECVVTHSTLAEPDITTSPITILSPVNPTPTNVLPKQLTAYPSDLKEIECSVMSAGPAVQITWTFNGTDITSDADVMETRNNLDGTSMTSSTLHRVFKQEDNGHKLECVIVHPTLEEPDVTFIPITVYFPPVKKQVHTFYPIELNSYYEIILSFSANPQPTSLMWSFGPNLQEMANRIQIPFNNGKFSTSLIALLTLSEITNEDIETHFTLHVANEIGAADYSVIFSEAQNPVECKRGFIMVDGSTQCFKLYDEEIRNWNEAKRKCLQENLLPAEPTDEAAVNLRKHIFVKIG
ncbi:unnamed protein product, partial [Meganyctiphanes norvegica]